MTCCNTKWGVYWSNSGGTIHYINLNRAVSVLRAQTRHSKITTPERNSMCTDKQQTVCTMMQVTAIPVQILRSLQWHTKFSPSVAHSSCRAGGPSGWNWGIEEICYNMQNSLLRAEHTMIVSPIHTVLQILIPIHLFKTRAIQLKTPLLVKWCFSVTWILEQACIHQLVLTA